MFAVETTLGIRHSDLDVTNGETEGEEEKELV